jgi:hybrid cluster-associated redox disulfide protein
MATKITKDMIIADIVKIDENVIPILMREGMHCIGCPSAQAESLEEAALVHGLNPDILVARLNNFLSAE